ncbi:protein transport protein SEC16B homolog [Pyrus x bretschneideri]|uniref:protein transport protein SEC16B homolog n=1 Tax=Pyrus x bretschneideri TaxID=225117 RepID=UPI00202EA0FD|nr:protein transport protein SEC16B homolog [Pyrus x bretschneideri]XP_009375751.2 protein transport protein SEC16B homolog [Pyrus x bretschneideri]
MASSPFEVEDTDEDFFDRLVNDDIDFTESVHKPVEKKEFVDDKAFSKLSISEAGPVGVVDTGGNASLGVNGELGHEDGAVVEQLGVSQVPAVVKESESMKPDSRNEASALDNIADNRKGVSLLDDRVDIRNAAGAWDDMADNRNEASALEDKAGNTNEAEALEDKGKEGSVNGTVNTSLASVGSGVKVAQWSSFNLDLNPSGEFGDVSGDPFVNLGDPDKLWAESNVTDSGLENSVPDLGVSSYGQHQEGQRYGVVEGQNLDGQDLNTSLASVGSGVKEVQWTSFNSGFDPSGDFGDFSGDPFANLGNTDQSWATSNVTDGALESSVAGVSSYGQQQGGQHYGAVKEQSTDGQELNSSQNWDNLYPGWRYDPNTRQWYQLEGYDVNANTSADLNINANVQERVNVNSQTADNVFSDQKADVYYLPQQAQSVSQSAALGSETSAVSGWNQHSNGSTVYPAHMIFDPQYPGWYYDTITQEWKQLESSTPAFDQSTSVEYNQQYHNLNVENHGSDVANSDGSMSTYNQQNASMWDNQKVSASDTISVTETQQYATQYFSTGHVTNSVNQQIAFNPSGSVALNQPASHGYDLSSGVQGFESFNPAGNLSHHHHQAKEPNQVTRFSPANFDSHKPVQFLQQPIERGAQFSHEASAGRSSAGHPPHALVTFGFGGKLITMKDNSNIYGSQDSVGGLINVLNLMEVVVVDKTDVASFGNDGCAYFHALCQQSYPGPLVGGSVGSREVNKWIDDNIANCVTASMDIRKRDHSRLLFSLLKIGCQYYGKLRSPFGTDVALKESDSPESAVAKLFASAKGSNEYGALMLQNLPSEAQSQATALEVQNLLVSGRKKEALQCSQNGQLWGPALVIASQLGEQFYSDTVKLMALNQLAAGSPLRTLCLLIARQPADVFSNATTDSSLHNSMNVSQDSQQRTQIGANSMLDEWEENLAILTANRTKDDELVIIHLGDCLWKERGQNTPAHICYLVAEANFEAYSDSARLCLIGADHLKYPRTYASPEAIQRTELYEYARVLGNSQFLLLPFQPYKLVYAHMLAEVGKVADALKYCQAILKSLKYGRAPEVDTWRQLVSSLEERIRAHQQGGYGTNSAPTKLMGKLLTLFDNTAHRVVGGLPPPAPSTSQVIAQCNEHAQQPGGSSLSNNQSTMAMPSFMPGPSPPNSQSTMAVSSFTPGPSVPNSQSTMAVSSFVPGPSVLNSQSTMAVSSFIPEPSVPNTQSTMAMSPLMPSASMEPISEWTAKNNQLNVPNRSISEPDFGRSPSKVDSSKKVESSKPQENASTSTGSSRFGFGIFQKTLGFVKRSRQAKLGEKNKFYYDEKLKQWVEEGVEPPAKEAALPPPPPIAAFPNRMQDYNINDALETKSFPAVNGSQIPSLMSPEPSSGIPLIPPSSNQFSARGRTGVRSRYVDTFNKGGGTPANLFQSPSLPSAKPVGGPKPKIFVPAPVTSYEETVQTTGESTHEPTVTNNNPPKSFESAFSTPQASTSSSMTMQRFPSMDNIVQKRAGDMGNGNSYEPHESRRVASWSGSLNHASNPSMRNEIKPLGQSLGISPPSRIHSGAPPPMQFPSSGGSFGDDLQEVAL